MRSAKAMAPQRSCEFPGVFISPGPTTPRFRMEIDSGTQTRLFHFGGTVPANQARNVAGLLGG